MNSVSDPFLLIDIVLKASIFGEIDFAFDIRKLALQSLSGEEGVEICPTMVSTGGQIGLGSRREKGTKRFSKIVHQHWC